MHTLLSAQQLSLPISTFSASGVAHVMRYINLRYLLTYLLTYLHDNSSNSALSASARHNM